MSDWLSDFERKQVAREQAETAERADDERKRRAEQELKRQRVAFYEAHRDQVDLVYRVLEYMDRAARVVD